MGPTSCFGRVPELKQLESTSSADHQSLHNPVALQSRLSSESSGAGLSALRQGQGRERLKGPRQSRAGCQVKPYGFLEGNPPPAHSEDQEGHSSQQFTKGRSVSGHFCLLRTSAFRLVLKMSSLLPSKSVALCRGSKKNPVLGCSKGCGPRNASAVPVLL